jgi:hypothetical protein
MLLGTSIVMAWQTSGTWRVGWQFAAMAAGVLLTASIGWARIAASANHPWREREVCLLISAGMMTMMTWFGLSQGLPQQSDWIVRGRQAAPVFAGMALLLLASVLVQKHFAGP